MKIARRTCQYFFYKIDMSDKSESKNTPTNDKTHSPIKQSQEKPLVLSNTRPHLLLCKPVLLPKKR